MKSKGDFPNLNQKIPDGIRPNGRPYKVMVVEDQEFQRKQLVQILESEGYEVVASAEDGNQALSKYDAINGSVDLITTNLDMPNIDGYALTFELSKKPSKPVIVFISQDTTKGVMQDLINMGIADYILKPINRKTVLDRIKKVITKHVT